MAVVNGKLWVVMDGATVIGASTSAKLTMKQSHEETHNKTTADDFITRMVTTKDWSISFEGLHDPAQALNAEELVDIMLLATNTMAAKFQPSSPATNDILLAGTGILDTFEIDVPNQAPSTISGNIVANGPLAKTVQT